MEINVAMLYDIAETMPQLMHNIIKAKCNQNKANQKPTKYGLCGGQFFTN